MFITETIQHIVSLMCKFIICISYNIINIFIHKSILLRHTLRLPFDSVENKTRTKEHTEGKALIHILPNVYRERDHSRKFSVGILLMFLMEKYKVLNRLERLR